MLMCDRVEGIVSGGFRQGKLIFDYFDRWAKSKPFFRSQLDRNRLGEVCITHGNEVYEAKFRSGCVIRMIPPSWGTEGATAYSEDWTDGYFDEWSNCSDLQTLDRVFVGRVRRPIPEEYDNANPIFGHHFFFGGQAGYTYQAPYAKIEQFRNARALGGDRERREYGLQSWSYKDIPPRYDRLIPWSSIRLQMGAMREDEVKTKLLGLWVSDSVSYYPARDIAQTPKAECPVLGE
jgi:hypothetical protein